MVRQEKINFGSCFGNDRDRVVVVFIYKDKWVDPVRQLPSQFWKKDMLTLELYGIGIDLDWANKIDSTF